MTLIEMEAIKLMKQGFFSDLFSGISIMVQGKNGRTHPRNTIVESSMVTFPYKSGLLFSF